ncbi:acyltransferase ChoActase/COT/CPT [Coemansia spiralis]|nr:acyltransferase ChoActase/COT/CPT [Coemansia spiralis]
MSEQAKIPRLPIPALKATVDRCLRSIEPLVRNNIDALAETSKKAMDFLKVANRLQHRLTVYEKTQPNSWLESWWLELAYLSWREGLCINSNYWIAFADDPNAYDTAKASDIPLLGSQEYLNGKSFESNEYGEFQIRRAVKFIQKTLDYKELINNGHIPVDKTKAGPLCMYQYQRMFGVTRVPRMGCDELRQTRSSTNSRTIVVIADDQLYCIKVYDSVGRRRLDGDLESDLHAVVADVVERKRRGDLDPAISVLTAGHRDRWSVAYEKLQNQPANSTTLAAVQDALFAVSLDTTFGSPAGSINAHQQNFKCHGTRPGHNRWYDKCVSFVVDRNGTAGYVGEHSPCDALIPAIMLEEVVKNVARDHITRNVVSACTPNYVSHVKRLRFTDVDASVLKLVDEAEHEVEQAASISSSRQIRFENYGSSWIKRVAKVSPDAFTQLALQLTYYRIHKEFAPVYETASTRQFLHGRTETVRSLSSEAADFMQAMNDAASSSADKYEAIARASAKHQALLREASAGQGIDRHIFGLRMAYHRLAPLPDETPISDEERHAIEEFFGDAVLAKSATFHLSTSGLFPAYYLTHTGFGCVVRERGYGINYIIEEGKIKFGIEGKTKEAGNGTDVDLFESTLRQVLLELKLICEQSSGVQTGDLSRL